MPSSREMKKKFDMIQKEFTALRSKNAQIRQDMLSLHESSEILKTVAESIMGQEDKIAALKSEMESVAEEAAKIEIRTKAIASQVRQNADFVERLGDSVDVAKTVLKKFPCPGEGDSRAGQTEERGGIHPGEKRVSGEDPGGVGGQAAHGQAVHEVAKKMDDRMLQMRKDMDALETALEDEKGTYLTFQKIKEKVVPIHRGIPAAARRHAEEDRQDKGGIVRPDGIDPERSAETAAVAEEPGCAGGREGRAGDT